MTQWTTVSFLFDRIAIDIVGPLNDTKQQNKYIVTIHDDLTKVIKILPNPDKTAATVCATLLNEFLNSTFKEFLKFFDITRIHTTAYHLQSNGGIERMHGILD